VELSIDFHGYVAYQAGRAGTMSHFDGGNRLFAGLDGIEPVEVLFGSFVQVDILRTNL
jgi:hypothetical protein